VLHVQVDRSGLIVPVLHVQVDRSGLMVQVLHVQVDRSGLMVLLVASFLCCRRIFMESRWASSNEWMELERTFLQLLLSVADDCQSDVGISEQPKLVFVALELPILASFCAVWQLTVEQLCSSDIRRTCPHHHSCDHIIRVLVQELLQRSRTSVLPCP